MMQDEDSDEEKSSQLRLKVLRNVRRVAGTEMINEYIQMYTLGSC